MALEIQDRSIPYKVRRSDNAARPRIEFKQGMFTVVLPSGTGLKSEAVLKSNESWVLKQYNKYLEFCKRVPQRSLEEGSSLNILGEEKEIVVEKRRSNSVEDKIMLASYLVERNCIKQELEKVLREEARVRIELKLDKYSDHVSRGYDKLFIRDQKTRWGSCSSKNNLNFNWRLILGPENVLEYVVVHELVHLEEKNHGESFWNRVEEIFPMYRESKKWLEENSHQLVWSLD